ncbi:MAG: Endonuclease/exonuclease/phosphatase [Monoraphidium minutum]|nr:MAG: Endonuclease/exonuclease/phosphatase [Monoraphidium minutum]
MRPPRCADPALVVMSWNVASLRALLKKDKDALKKVVERERVDVLCLQETKLQESHVDGIQRDLGLPGWLTTFSCSTAKKGYSGVATLCRAKPQSSSCGMGVAEHDQEGRVITVELPEAFVVNAYVPNSGDGLLRLAYRTKSWDVAFADYVRGLEARGKPVIVAGDLNCSHQPIDIHNPKGNLKSAGFTQEERDSFGAKLLVPSGPLVDTFRAQHPGVVGFTYYSRRFGATKADEKGWRLDYCLVSESLAPRVHDSFILKDVEGSDHVPLGLVLKKA